MGADKPTRRHKASRPSWLRIVGGRLRGQRIRYSGNPQVRPMKDRLRETLFNLLGETVEGKHAIDLFAGTGALGIEAISRGAAAALLIERHRPTVELIKENVGRLGLENQATVLVADAFRWLRHVEQRPAVPWLLLVCPPYEYFTRRTAEMIELVEELVREAPSGSTVVVETVESFPLERLPQPEKWDVRLYRPAVLAILYETA